MMSKELDLYNLVENWIDYYKKCEDDKCEEQRDKFGITIRDVICSPEEGWNNPLYMKYDSVRNILVGFVKGDDKDPQVRMARVKEASLRFSKIHKPKG